MILPVIVIAAFVLLTGFRVAQEYQRGVVFRLGRYIGLRGPGLYWIIPLGIDRAVTIDIRTRTVSAEQKDVELPADMQEVMAMQAQAIREKRARIIKADAELEASRKLADAAAQMAGNPVAVELRRMQMVTEVGAENNSTTILVIPSDFVTLAKGLSEYLRERGAVS